MQHGIQTDKPVYQEEEAHMYSTVSTHKIINTIPIEEIIFLITNVNRHQSTDTSNCKYQLELN